MTLNVKTCGRFSKSRGLRASVPSFSLFHPPPSTFLLSPHFSCSPNAKKLFRAALISFAWYGNACYAGYDQAKQSLLEQQKREHEAARERAAKCRKLNENGQQVSKIDFAASSGDERLESESMTSEIPDFQVQEPPEKEATIKTEGPEQNEAGSQTEEFDYVFMPAGYQAPDQEYFDSDAKVRFYTELPSYEVLIVVFEHVSSHVSRQTQNLSRFQEFVMVLIKLRLNVPLQDLAYPFVVSVTTVSRIFSNWMVVMDVRLKFMISWPEREQVW